MQQKLHVLKQGSFMSGEELVSGVALQHHQQYSSYLKRRAHPPSSALSMFDDVKDVPL